MKILQGSKSCRAAVSAKPAQKILVKHLFPNLRQISRFAVYLEICDQCVVLHVFANLLQKHIFPLYFSLSIVQRWTKGNCLWSNYGQNEATFCFKHITLMLFAPL